MRRHQNIRPQYIRTQQNSKPKGPLIDFLSDISICPQYIRSQQTTLVGQAKPSSSSTVTSGEVLHKGDSTIVLEQGDLIDFKNDVVHITKQKSKPNVSVEKGDCSDKAGENGLIDFQSDIEWPAGQAPLQGMKSAQVKRKMENPEYKMVTAHLVHTQKGAQILVKGIENPAILDEDQKEFIRIQVKEVLIREVAASKTWGKLPSVQTTFQLGRGN